jgi:hypothetical protein
MCSPPNSFWQCSEEQDIAHKNAVEVFLMCCVMNDSAQEVQSSDRAFDSPL